MAAMKNWLIRKSESNNDDEKIVNKIAIVKVIILFLRMMGKKMRIKYFSSLPEPRNKKI